MSMSVHTLPAIQLQFVPILVALSRASVHQDTQAMEPAVFRNVQPVVSMLNVSATQLANAKMDIWPEIR